MLTQCLSLQTSTIIKIVLSLMVKILNKKINISLSNNKIKLLVHNNYRQNDWNVDMDWIRKYVKHTQPQGFLIVPNEKLRIFTAQSCSKFNLSNSIPLNFSISCLQMKSLFFHLNGIKFQLLTFNSFILVILSPLK